MSCECKSVSKNENPSVVEVKEEWSRGLELDTFLETAISERGLNEDPQNIGPEL